MAMTFIEKVGNLKLFYEEWEQVLFAEPAFTIYAINGADIVGKETYLASPTPQAIRAAVERFLQHTFDYCTYQMISAGVQEIISEYDGRLLSGKIAGFSETDYFKKIDSTRFYKHFTRRPQM